MLLIRRRKWLSSNLPTGRQMKNFCHRRKFWLDYEQLSENAILVLTWLESDQELNTRVIEYFLIFPMIICIS
jgi:hypothetical protein